MQLPQPLHPFKLATLVVTADHVHALLWLGKDRQLDKIDQLEEPKPEYADKPATFVNTEHGSSSTEESLDDERLRHWIKRLAERIERLCRDQDVAAIHLAMPADVSHQLHDKLSPKTRCLISKEYHKDVMKLELKDVIERLQHPDRRKDGVLIVD